MTHAPVKWGDDETPGVECLTCGHVQPTDEGKCPRCGTKLTQLQPKARPSGPVSIGGNHCLIPMAPARRWP